MLWPVFASIAPVSSFPLTPACHCTHSNMMLAVLARSHAVAHLKSWPWATPIQSLASQSRAYFVSPSIVNLESIRISSGRLLGVSLITWRIANSSPTWFNCGNFTSTGVSAPTVSACPNGSPIRYRWEAREFPGLFSQKRHWTTRSSSQSHTTRRTTAYWISVRFKDVEELCSLASLASVRLNDQIFTPCDNSPPYPFPRENALPRFHAQSDLCKHG